MKILRTALLFALVGLSAHAALAQAAPAVGTVTLTAAGNVLTWSTTATPDGTAAGTCTGSWGSGGSVPTSGTATVAPQVTTTYTITCTWTDLNVVLDWTAPTQNTNNTPLAANQLPLTYSVNAGATGAEVNIKTGIAAQTYTDTMAAPGQRCYTVNAVDALADVSAPTNEVCATTAPATASASATVTVKLVPNAPTGLSIASE